MAESAPASHAEVVWAGHPGGQREFLACPCFEVLLEGNRGGGKTDVLLMDFAQFVGRGFGPAWRGILFRQTYPNLEEVIAKANRWFPRIFHGVRYNAGSHYWRWPSGETLYFRHASRESDYSNYHGHEYPWVGWEELTNWKDDRLYIDMMSVCRSSHPGMPRRYRATTNPYGVGHQWVKARFIDPSPRGVPIRGADGVYRVAVHLAREENFDLLLNDPQYIKRLEAQDGPKREAWLHGTWDITAGGMFDDIWDVKVHVIEPFEIPSSWYVDRSFDWGSSRPYSVGWWAESDGTMVKRPDGRTVLTQKGDLFRVSELYGWTGKPNEGTRELAVEVGRKIRDKEKFLKLHVRPGPADPSIYSRQNANCIADDMSSVGIGWKPADVSPGSRQNGWEVMRRVLKQAKNREGPGLFIFDTCRQFIRTVPCAPRDDRDMDDINSDAEDHIADEARYRCLAKKSSLSITVA